MDSSERQALITSLQQAKLLPHSSTYNTLAEHFFEMREEMATSRETGQPMDTQVWRSLELAWGLAMTAQSCAYLALELQMFADRLSQWQITSPELIYKRLLDSDATFRRLLDIMRQSYAESNADESGQYLPVLNEHLVEEIRYTLDLELATTSGGYTTNTRRAKTMRTENVGDTS